MRLLRPVAIVVAVVAGVGVGAWLAGRGDSSTPAPAGPSTAQPAATAVHPRGALLLGRRAGDVLVGLAARPGGPVDVVAIPPDLGVLGPGAVRASAAGRSAAAVPCGRQCLRFDLRVLDGRARTVAVTVRGRRAVFPLPARLPRPATARLRAATRRMKALPSVRVHESLSSGRSTVRARFDLQAPDRMRYVTSDGQRAVVIGETRWDRQGGAWRRSPYSRIPQPAYMWQGARFARALGPARVDGRPVDLVAAFRPDAHYPAWFRLAIDRGGHVVRAEMTAPAHFMVDRMSAFGRAPAITPPG